MLETAQSECFDIFYFSLISLIFIHSLLFNYLFSLKYFIYKKRISDVDVFT